MSEYTKSLTAVQLLRFIADDYVELSHDKVRWQRDDHMRICREWLQHAYETNGLEPAAEVSDEF